MHRAKQAVAYWNGSSKDEKAVFVAEPRLIYYTYFLIREGERSGKCIVDSDELLLWS